jgi:hypothetical protein
MSDSDDDVPLMRRAAQATKKPEPEQQAAKRAAVRTPNGPGAKKPAPKEATARATPSSGSGGKKSAPKRKLVTESESEDEEDDDDDGDDEEDEVPLSKRKAAKKPTPKKAKAAPPTKRQKRGAAAAAKPSGGKRGSGGGDAQVMWESLVHGGVQFPPEYEPHGVKMLYDGRPVELMPEQEEVASMFAIMKETEYMQKPKFLENFWRGFKEVGCRGALRGPRWRPRRCGERLKGAPSQGLARALAQLPAAAGKPLCGGNPADPPAGTTPCTTPPSHHPTTPAAPDAALHRAKPHAPGAAVAGRCPASGTCTSWAPEARARRPTG